MLMKQVLLIISILVFLTCFIWSVGFGITWYHRVFGLISIIGWTFCCLKYEAISK